MTARGYGRSSFSKGVPSVAAGAAILQSQNGFQELSYSEQDCLHCGTCEKMCTKGAIRFHKWLPCGGSEDMPSGIGMPLYASLPRWKFGSLRQNRYRRRSPPPDS